jgi:hypothetical protein
VPVQRVRPRLIRVDLPGRGEFAPQAGAAGRRFACGAGRVGLGSGWSESARHVAGNFAKLRHSQARRVVGERAVQVRWVWPGLSESARRVAGNWHHNQARRVDCESLVSGFGAADPSRPAAARGIGTTIRRGKSSVLMLSVPCRSEG